MFGWVTAENNLKAKEHVLNLSLMASQCKVITSR